MVKALEVAGLGLVGIMILCYVGALRPTVEAGTSAVFWGCAAGALGMIVLRRQIRKRSEAQNSSRDDTI